VGSIPDFLFLLAADKAYVKDLFEVRTEVALQNLPLLKQYLGDSIDVIGFDGYDFGSQNGEIFSPDLCSELFLPNMKVQSEWVHRNTPWKTFYHSCGSITRIIPMLIEGGMDILNPVQTSAKGMDPAWLKKEFGKRIVFWGGGVDTQKTLPFGSTEEVVREVTERVRIFAPGGGFVFNAVHNIQQGTPPENIVAAYETARTVGTYPIR
jgi:uroporphyrinogen-III decarboxylase